jgi:PKD repeat protein
MQKDDLKHLIVAIIAIVAIILAVFAIAVPEDEEDKEEISNVPPSANISVTNTTFEEMTTVNFDASGSTDSDGTIVEYTWDFGDSTEDNGIIVNHAFDNPGSYIVVLTVFDDDGASHIDTLTITVISSVSPITTPTGSFSFSESATIAGVYTGSLASISDEILISDASVTIIDDSTGQSATQDPLLNNTPFQVGVGLKLTFTDSNGNGKLDTGDVWKAENAASGDQIRLVYRPTGGLIASSILT